MLQRRIVPIAMLLVAHSANAETLDQLLYMSLQSHPAVSEQEFRVEAGRSEVETATWQYYPTLGLDFSTNDRTNSFSERTFSESFNNFADSNTTTVSLEQPLWTGGRISGGLGRANAALAGAEKSLAQIQREVALNVVQAYGQWYAAKLSIEGWEESLEAHVRLSELVDRRLEEGLSSDSDKLLAESRLESVRASMAAALAQEQIALSSLSQLVGLVINGNDLSVANVLPVIKEDIDILMAQSLELSPGIQQALVQVDAAEAEVSIQKSNRLPEVFLRVEHEFGSVGPMQGSFSDSRVYLGVRTRFGAGLSSFSATNSSRAAYQASLNAVNVQKRITREQVYGDYYLRTSFAAQLAALENSTNTTAQVFDSYNRQFLAGRKTWLDLLNSARDLTQSKIQLAQAESSHLVVTWRLALFTQVLDELVSGATAPEAQR